MSVPLRPRPFSKIQFRGIKPYLFGKKRISNCVQLVSLGYSRITQQQLEAVRKSIKRKSRRDGVLLQYIRASVPVTRKPLQSRMGRGKGKIVNSLFFVYPGQIIFSLERCSSFQKGFQFFSSALFRLPGNYKILAS